MDTVRTDYKTYQKQVKLSRALFSLFTSEQLCKHTAKAVLHGRTCWRMRLLSWIIHSSSASWPTWRRECTTFTPLVSAHTVTSRVPTALSTLAGPSRSVLKSLNELCSIRVSTRSMNSSGSGSGGSSSGSIYWHFAAQCKITYEQ